MKNLILTSAAALFLSVSAFANNGDKCTKQCEKKCDMKECCIKKQECKKCCETKCADAAKCSKETKNRKVEVPKTKSVK